MFSSCTGYQDDLSPYLDGELDEGRKPAIESHLAECGACRDELSRLKSLSRLMASGLKSEALAVPDIWGALAGRLPDVCSLMREDFSAYIDGELPAAAQEAMKEHVRDCAPCRSRFQGLSQAAKLISNALLLPGEVNVDLWAAVRSRLNEDCALIQSELSAFVDQEVATLRHRSITGHLLDCPNCRELFDGLSKVGDIVRQSYQPDFPADFDLWPEVKARLQVVPFAVKAKTRPRMLSQRLYLAGAAAVVAGALGTLAFFLFGPMESGVRPVSAESYLLESALAEPSDSAEEVVYENQ